MDVLVLGGGPAGATAAIYAARSGKAVTLVYQDSGALARAERIENFYGFPAPISGPDLFCPMSTAKVVRTFFYSSGMEHGVIWNHLPYEPTFFEIR